MSYNVIELPFLEGDIAGDGSGYTRTSNIVFTGGDSLTEEALLKNLKDAQESLTFNLTDFLTGYKRCSDDDVSMAQELKRKGFMDYGATGFGKYDDDYTYKFNLQIFSAHYFPAMVANMCIMGADGKINLEDGAGYHVEEELMWLKRPLTGIETALNSAIKDGYTQLNYTGAQSHYFSFKTHNYR